MIYYVAGVPYSDELYHSGVKGMKWGVRRYQNLDRTLTPLGKIHYGASKVGRAVGNAALSTGRAVGRATAATGREVGSIAKRAGAGIKRKIKSKHQWLMTEEDYKEYTNRLALEASYREAKKKANANKASTKFKEFLGKTLDKGVSTLVENTTKSFGTEIGKNLSKSKTEKKAEKYANKALLKNRKIENSKAKIGLDTQRKNEKKYFDSVKPPKPATPSKPSWVDQVIQRDKERRNQKQYSDAYWRKLQGYKMG